MGSCHNLCFSFPLDITAVPREIKNNAYAKFCGANKAHYGICASAISTASRDSIQKVYFILLRSSISPVLVYSFTDKERCMVLSLFILANYYRKRRSHVYNNACKKQVQYYNIQ